MPHEVGTRGPNDRLGCVHHVRRSRGCLKLNVRRRAGASCYTPEMAIKSVFAACSTRRGERLTSISKEGEQETEAHKLEDRDKIHRCWEEI